MAVVTVNAIEFPSKKLEFEDLKSRINSGKTKTRINARPKSTPIKLRSEGMEKFFIPPNRNIQTAVPTFRTDVGEQIICDRVKTAEYRMPLSRPITALNRTKKKEVNFEPSEVYNLGPGYVILRNGAEFNIKIDSEMFFSGRKKEERAESTRKYQEDQKDIRIRQLLEQISNLNVELAEEKVNHEMSIEKWQQHLQDTIISLETKFDNAITTLMKNHKEEINNIEENHKLAMETQKQNLLQETRRIEKELDTFKASFEAFRQNFIRETEEKFEKEKAEMNKLHGETLLTSLEKQKRELTANFEVDLEKVKEEHEEEKNNLIQKQKHEIDRLNRRYADAADLEEKLSQTVQDLSRARREFSKLMDECESMRDAHNSTRRELAVVSNENDSLKSELQEFSDRFEERVRRVDDDYKQKMDTLQNQIVEIRRAYVLKCEELVNARKESESQLQGKIETAKDVMKEIIHSRQRARISLVSVSEFSQHGIMSPRSSLTGHGRTSGDLLTPAIHTPGLTSNASHSYQNSRPSSAPITNQDQIVALHKSHNINKDII